MKQKKPEWKVCYQPLPSLIRLVAPTIFVQLYLLASLLMFHHEPSKCDMHSLATTNTATAHGSLIGPSVRRLLDSYGLDTHLIKPSGHKGQILKGDVLKYINENAKTEIDFSKILQEKTPKASSLREDYHLGYVDIGLSSNRQAMAIELVESKTKIPHTYSSIDCNIDSLLALCNKFQKYDQSVSIYDFIIKAAALTLQQVQGVNATWFDDGIVHLNGINIAVTVESANGLITPVINHADQLDVFSISKTRLELEEKAKTGTLKSNEPQNGSFTISNLGTLGVKALTAVVNPSQSAVLGVGDCQAHVDDDYKLSNIVNVTLSRDGRVIDEPLASAWLTVFKDMIEKPLKMGL